MQGVPGQDPLFFCASSAKGVGLALMGRAPRCTLGMNARRYRYLDHRRGQYELLFSLVTSLTQVSGPVIQAAKPELAHYASMTDLLNLFGAL